MRGWATTMLRQPRSNKTCCDDDAECNRRGEADQHAKVIKCMSETFPIWLRNNPAIGVGHFRALMDLRYPHPARRFRRQMHPQRRRIHVPNAKVSVPERQAAWRQTRHQQVGLRHHGEAEGGRKLDVSGRKGPHTVDCSFQDMLIQTLVQGEL